MTGCNCAFLSSQRQKWVQPSVIVEIAHHSLCTNCDACIADEPLARLRISINWWMQNLQSFTHKKINRRKRALRVWRSSDFPDPSQCCVITAHLWVRSWQEWLQSQVFFLCCQTASEHCSFLGCFKSWACYCTTKAVMHPCADVSWIDNVYQNLQKFLALEETQTKDEDRQPQSTLSRAPILLQSSSLANASLLI